MNEKQVSKYYERETKLLNFKEKVNDCIHSLRTEGYLTDEQKVFLIYHGILEIEDIER